MERTSQRITHLDPFTVTTIENDGGTEFVRFEATVHPALDADGDDGALDHERFLFDNPDEHIHPHQREDIEVLVGEYAVEIAGTEHQLETGDEISIPVRTPHRHWNPSGEPVRVAHEHHPARGSAEHAQAMWALAQKGKTDENGLPNPLQFAVLDDAYPGIVYSAAIPIPIQKGLLAVLAPVGRLLGYHADHSTQP